MSNLKGKVILITGASRGIGADMAIALAEQGAKLIINYANSANEAEKVSANIKENGGTAIVIKADVSKENEVETLFDQSIKEFGKIDVLINNAGMMKTKFLKDYTEAEFDQHFDINVKGTFSLSNKPPQNWQTMVSSSMSHPLQPELCFQVTPSILQQRVR
jgi:3-oxoacyl-[acyl-carrier protein] reductase